MSFEKKCLNHRSDLALWMISLFSRTIDICLYVILSTEEERVKMEGEQLRLSWGNIMILVFAKETKYAVL